MSGVTHFGFASGAGANDPGAVLDPRSVRTVFGRDRHLPPELRNAELRAVHPRTVQDRPSAGGSGAPRRVTAATSIDVAPAAPIASGKSHLPAIVRWLGRWNTRGDFESVAPTDDESLTVPRPAWVRPALLASAAALFTFAVVLAFATLWNRAPGHNVRETTKAAPAIATAAKPTELASPPAPAQPVEAKAQPVAGSEPTVAPRSAAKAARPVTRRASRPGLTVGPDDPLPARF